MRFSNFRDLHDVYPKIREKKLFRSEAPFDFQKEDWDELYNLGVRTIIDFRSDSEEKKITMCVIQDLRVIIGVV